MPKFKPGAGGIGTPVAGVPGFAIMLVSRPKPIMLAPGPCPGTLKLVPPKPTFWLPEPNKKFH